jgi:Family of unknown function (DUF5343)
VPVTSDAPAPYAPASAILGIIGRYRDKGLPLPINAEVLGRISITESLVPRTLQALKSLDLIDDDGKPTQMLETLRLAPEAEYQQCLAQWLAATFADVLQFVDPATANDTVLRDAFRSYRPIAQQPRMITLFKGLYAAAGIGHEKTKAGSTTVRSKPAPSLKAKPAEQKRTQSSNGAGNPSPPPPMPPAQNTTEPNTFEKDLLAKFPSFDPAWSEDIKASWFKGFQQFMDIAKAKT